MPPRKTHKDWFEGNDWGRVPLPYDPKILPRPSRPWTRVVEDFYKKRGRKGEREQENEDKRAKEEMMRELYAMAKQKREEQDDKKPVKKKTKPKKRKPPAPKKKEPRVPEGTRDLDIDF